MQFQFTRSMLLVLVAFILVLMAVISFATSPIAGVSPFVWAWGGVDAYLLSILVP